jgi:membrane peptidoglycan carboxypeptidase
LVWRAPQNATQDDVPGYTLPLPQRAGWRGRRDQAQQPPRQQPPRQQPARRKSRTRRYVKRAAITLAVIIAVCAIGFGSLLLATPSATDATTLAAQQAREHGIAYPGPPVPANFSRPLIATEDHRFYSEPGVDPLAVGRLIEGKITGSQDQGGATIEQQLAKLLYTPGQSGVMTELKQVALAIKINYTYSKAQILRLYAEVAYYGHGYYGLQAASCGYFGHPASQLTVVQGAMLAGVVNAPSFDDPVSQPANAHARLAHVIARMVAVGDLSPAQGTKVLDTPLGVVPRGQAGC